MRNGGSSSFVLALATVLTIAFLTFVAGAWTAWRQNFPFDPMLRHAFVGATSIWTQHFAPKEPFASDVWMPREARETGVVAHLPERAYGGFTLVTAGQGAMLIDMSGTVVHRWRLPYDQIAGKPGGQASDIPDTWLYWRPAPSILMMRSPALSPARVAGVSSIGEMMVRS